MPLEVADVLEEESDIADPSRVVDLNGGMLVLGSGAGDEASELCEPEDST